MSILVNRAKSGFIPCMRTLYANTSRSSFRQFSTGPITTPVDNASLKKMTIALKNMQKDLQKIRHARSQPLQNVDQLDKALTNLQDAKKAADMAQIVDQLDKALTNLQNAKKAADMAQFLVFAGLLVVGIVGFTTWVLIDLHEKHSRAEFQELREDIKEAEKRLIESNSKDIRLALSEHGNQFLKAQQNKESRK